MTKINHHQRHKAVHWRSSSPLKSTSSNGGKLRSNGNNDFLHEDSAISPSSSITEDEESQSLWQSSGTTGGVRGYLREPSVRFADLCGGWGGRGPLNDSTVLLILLVVGLCGFTICWSWISWKTLPYNLWSKNGSLLLLG